MTQPYDDVLIAAGLKFLPWEGVGYADGCEQALGLRLLILGESHHDNPGLGARSDFTRLVVGRQVRAASPSEQFWRKIEALFGVPPAAQSIARFWSSLAFANYVQMLLPEAQARPTAAEFRDARPFMAPLVDALKPDAVVALGHEAWLNMPGRKLDWTTVTPAHERFAKSGYEEIFALDGGYHSAPALHVLHPSYKGGFRPDEWKPLVDAFLIAVAERREGA